MREGLRVDVLLGDDLSVRLTRGLLSGTLLAARLPAATPLAVTLFAAIHLFGVFSVARFLAVMLLATTVVAFAIVAVSNASSTVVALVIVAVSDASGICASLDVGERQSHRARLTPLLVAARCLKPTLGERVRLSNRSEGASIADIGGGVAMGVLRGRIGIGTEPLRLTVLLGAARHRFGIVIARHPLLRRDIETHHRVRMNGDRFTIRGNLLALLQKWANPSQQRAIETGKSEEYLAEILAVAARLAEAEAEGFLERAGASCWSR